MRHEQSLRGTESNTPMFMTYSFVIVKIIDKHNIVYFRKNKYVYYYYYYYCLGCPTLSVTNGKVTYNQDPSPFVYKPNTISTASCNDGYEKKQGWHSRTCKSGGRWNGYILECQESNLQLLLDKTKYIMDMSPKMLFC